MLRKGEHGAEPTGQRQVVPSGRRNFGKNPQIVPQSFTNIKKNTWLQGPPILVGQSEGVNQT